MIPSRKIQAVAVGGAVATIVAWLIGATTPLDVPPGVESAFAIVIATVVGWFVRDREGA